jgi:hypothetical protein
VLLRACAAQRTRQPLDIQLWVPRPGGAPRLIWLYGIREAAADRNAPLVGAIVDITRIAHSLKFATSHGAAATADPTRIGRFS